jgi:hypothetical protein
MFRLSLLFLLFCFFRLVLLVWLCRTEAYSGNVVGPEGLEPPTKRL